jgi:spoIIIJ-associated protein
MPAKDEINIITVEAKTVQDAIKKALKKLKLHRDHVEVNIIEREKSGFLGLGAKKAKVTVREKKWTHPKHINEPKPKIGQKSKTEQKRFQKKSRYRQETQKPKFAGKQKIQITAPGSLKPVPADIQKNAELAKETLSKILSYFNEKKTDINIGWDDTQERLVANFKCKDPSIIIGKEGNTISAIQYLITLIISRKTGRETPLLADTENYWRKYEEKIISFVEYGMKNVKRTGKDFRLRPMPAATRRFVHKYLSKKSDIETVSEGEGKWRKVVIRPKK